MFRDYKICDHCGKLLDDGSRDIRGEYIEIKDFRALGFKLGDNTECYSLFNTRGTVSGTLHFCTTECFRNWFDKIISNTSFENQI